MWFNSIAIGLVLHSIDQQALLLLMFQRLSCGFN
jgi:hypothetical protein